MKRYTAVLIGLILGVATRLFAAPAESSAAAAPSTSANVEADLKAELQILDGRMRKIVQETIADAQRRTKDRKALDAVKKWGDTFLEHAAEIEKNADPMAALLDLWAFAEQMRHYVTEGEGAKLFGDAQATVAASVGGFNGFVAAVVDQRVPVETFGELRQRIDTYVASNPLKKPSSNGNYLFGLDQALFTVVDAGKSALSAVAEAPLIPGRAATGLQRGADELGQIRLTADEFSQTLQTLPADVRRELELFMTRLVETNEEMRQTIADLRATAEAFSLALTHADTLSGRSAKDFMAAAEAAGPFNETAQSFRDAAERAAGAATAFQNLLAEIDRRSAEGKARGETSESIADYSEAARAIEAAAREVASACEAIRLTQTDDAKEDAAASATEITPHDYAEAAQAVGTAAGQVRQSLAELRALLKETASDDDLAALSTNLQRVIDRAADRSEKLTDRVTWRALELMLAAFVLALAGIAIGRRIRRAWSKS